MVHVLNSPTQAKLPIDFVVVGAGIAGLACAIALRRVGHRVRVFEKNQSLLELSGGCRLPPNLSKIFYHWGLEKEVRAIAVKSQAISLQLFESGESLGRHVWDEEVLRETRGEFMFTHYSDLLKLLYDTAVEYGAEVRLGAQVKYIDADAQQVTLESGEVISGDVIVGADGTMGLSRKIMLEDVEEEEQVSRLKLYSTTVSKDVIMQDPDLATLYESELETMFSWFGNGRAVLGFPLGGTPEFAVYTYCPRDGSDGSSWEDIAPIESFQTVHTVGERRLQKISQLASPPACPPLVDYPELEDWVHDSGRLLIIGQAAHPLPPGSIQECAMAVEDGAVLAKLFSHLRSADQINSFLYAYQDLRQPRCTRVVQKEMGDIQFMTLPPGDFQEMRDGMMKAKRDAGLNVLDGAEGMEESAEWAEIKDVFGYDAEDEADNWWIEWGLLRERAKGANDFECGLVQKNIFVAQEGNAATLERV